MSKRTENKSIPVTKQMVWQAYKKVKRNNGSAGIDRVNLEAFGQNLDKNLYKLWNRLASGSYFPPAVKEVTIPKRDGRQRKLGIPTVGDRIAQQVIKDYFEPRLEAEFHEGSYGYRPNKSAHQAIAAVQSNVRKYGWVIDMDIRGFFDEMDHELLMKALRRHVEEKWVLMYIKRWLEAPIVKPTGETVFKQGKGTPQGGVISPLLANLYLHYTMDKWLDMYYPQNPFVRYADDIIVHCTGQREAEKLLDQIKGRLKKCSLELQEQKSKIVYCQDYRRKPQRTCKKFEFLGFSFRPESLPSRKGGMFLGYTCTISTASQKRINEEIKRTRFHRRSEAEITDLAKQFNPKIRGWVNYYGKYGKWGLEKVFRVFHERLVKWVLNKYKGFKMQIHRAYKYLHEQRRMNPSLFYHWENGYSI